MSRNPLFDTMFVLQNMEQGEGSIEGLNIKPFESGHRMAKFDLTFTVEESEAGLACHMEYATALFTKETIERTSVHMMQLIDAVLENPEQALSKLEMVTTVEKEQVLNIFNDTNAEYPRDKTIHALFEEQVEQTPNHIAVVYEDKQFTYAELNARAN